MNCKDISTKLVCYDNGTTKETLVAHYEYGKNTSGNTILTSTRYTNAEGNIVDTSSGTVTAGACSTGSSAQTVSIIDYESSGYQSTAGGPNAHDDLVLAGYTTDVEGTPIVTEPGVFLGTAHKTHNQSYYRGKGETGNTWVHMRVAFPNSQVLKTEEQKLTTTPSGISVQGITETTLPVGVVSSVTVTKESGNYVEVSFDGGATYPLRMNRNGTRTWGNQGEKIDVSQMRFRGGNATTDYDLIWENI